MKSFISFIIMTIVTILVCIVFVMLLSIVISTDSEEIQNGEIYSSVQEGILTETYTNTVVNEYFYNQLPEEAKTIYRGIKASEEEMKSGVHIIEFGGAFEGILSKEGGDLILGDYFQVALQAYRYDNPQIFYLETSKMVLKMEQTKKMFSTTYNAYIDCGDNPNYFVSGFSSKADVDLAVSKVEDACDKIIATVSGSTYEKVKSVHNYLVDNLSYDQTYSKDNIYNIYGALVNNVAVCEGYAESMQYIMQKLGIECLYVVGIGTDQNGGTENHAWNYISINEKWYGLDVTWDDPIIIGSGTVGADIRYKYFLRGSSFFAQYHQEYFDVRSGDGILSYPALQVNDY